MRVTRAAVFLVTVATTLSTVTHGYTFTNVNPATAAAASKPSSLTSNEENRIYGGNEADIADYPFLASLREPYLGTNVCSGTLIHPEYLLTAGHCVQRIEGILATFGTNTSTRGSGENFLQVRVIKQYRHPLYNKKKHLYDVGVLKLGAPVTDRKLAKLCKSDGSDHEVGTMVKVAGWGKTETGGRLSPVLRELTLPIISNAECAKFKKYVGRITDIMLCAGLGDGKDTCSGDSGGPLLVNDDTLIGCVSWGSKCGEQAGVFTRLSHVIDYIEDILAGNDGSKFGTPSSSGTSMQDTISSSVSDNTPTKIKSMSSSLMSNGAVANYLVAKYPVASYSESSHTDDVLSGQHQGGTSGDSMAWLQELLDSSSGVSKLLDAYDGQDGSKGTGEETATMVARPATKTLVSDKASDARDSVLVNKTKSVETFTDKLTPATTGASDSTLQTNLGYQNNLSPKQESV